ncbi:MAG: chorismate synthase [Oscillospiraceae bacterium]|nr:chorismate synthase [Oscillospiraceae bacterium]
MKNTFGNSVSLTLFGESHGNAIGCVLDGMAPGVAVDEAFIAAQMSRRKGIASVSTPRKEADEVRILSGVFQEKTTGTPICMMIENTTQRSNDYERTRFLARPGHADYTAQCKYGGCQDYRGGGHFSGRITAPLVAAGAIALTALKSKGISVGTHIAKCAGVKDRDFSSYGDDIRALSEKDMPVLSDEAYEQMLTAIKAARDEGDSVGGVLTTAVVGIPAGVGEPWFDTVESMLAHGLFSIPAVKGVEFGMGFAMSELRGSRANDPLIMEQGKVMTASNHNGGINGGITNGMPIVFSTCIKPTPSIFKPQQTVDFSKMENAEIRIKGRHDPAIIHRAAVVVDSITALTLCDLLAQHFGTDYLRG